jgi:hypothetical protein
VWSATVENYVRGDVVTSDGALWHANVETRGKPGASHDWTMMHKTGVVR